MSKNTIKNTSVNTTLTQTLTDDHHMNVHHHSNELKKMM